jgi:hypothetical protein
MAMELKLGKEYCVNSIYHFIIEPVRIHLKVHNLMESSIKELEEHHRWKVITWLLGLLQACHIIWEYHKEICEGLVEKMPDVE